MGSEGDALSAEGPSSATSHVVVHSHRPNEESSDPNVHEEVAKAQVLECLARLNEAAAREIRALQLPECAEHTVIQCLHRVIQSEEQLHETQPRSFEPIYALRFKHNCTAIGCTLTTCDLCEANPKKGCSSNFDKKYFKGDVIKAKCGGSLFVELYDSESGEALSDAACPPNTALDLSVVDGNKFEQLFPYATPTPGTMHALDSCTLVFGNEGRPLLRSEDKSHNRENGKVLINIQGPQTDVRELSVHCSSEALLSGRRPPFRLMARLVSTDNNLPLKHVVPAISTNFIVASGRSRLSQKKSIPFANDPVSRLEHMGKERIKKLGNLVVTAEEMNVEYQSSYPQKISTVSDFRKLAFLADTDGQLRQKVLHMLKMSEKAWEESRDHAANAITNDTRMRAWYRSGVTDIQGLVYACYMGEADIQRPVALLLDSEVILKERLSLQQRELMNELQAIAMQQWWEPNHPGWTFYNFDSEEYKKNHEALISKGPARLDRAQAKWTEQKKVHRPGPSRPSSEEGETGLGLPESKRHKTDTSLKIDAPRSPPSPPRVRSPYEAVYLPGVPEIMPSARGQPPNAFARTESSANALASYTGPVIPRSPPDSPFTRKLMGQLPKDARAEIPEMSCPRQGVPQNLFQQFYVTASAKGGKGPSQSSESNEVYPPLKTPFNTRALEMFNVDFGRGQRYTSDGSSDAMDPGHGRGRPSSQEERQLMNAVFAHGEHLPQATPPNHLSCSIESLPPQCKEAIQDDQRIHQMERNGGYSNQDFQHASEGQLHGLMKRPIEKRAAGDAVRMVPDDNSGSQVQAQEIAVQQAEPGNSGLFSYGIFLVPLSGDQRHDASKTSQK